MKAKLIKVDDGQPDGGFYILQGLNGETIEGNLSLKNCQAIERGYDLDTLAEELTESHNPNNNDFESGVKAGFQKALELMGDKKFTEEDLRKAFNCVHLTSTEKEKHWKKFPKSLQQNEWEVEIEMEVVDIQFDRSATSASDYNHFTTTSKPKLDQDGCLILKRVV